MATVTGNHHRRRLVTFPTVTTPRLRLHVTGTQGDASARIYEVRVHGPSEGLR